MNKPPWRDSMFDGATFIGPLMRATGGDEPPEFYWSNYFHDKGYYEKIRPRSEVDWDFYASMITAAEACPDPKRRSALLRKAKLRYAVVRKVGWLWWHT